MNFIDKIKQKTGAALIPVEIEEWGETIYFTPFTLEDTDFIQRMSKGRNGEFVAWTIIRKVRDENGKPRFTKDDLKSLMSDFRSEDLSSVTIKMKMAEADYFADLTPTDNEIADSIEA